MKKEMKIALIITLIGILLLSFGILSPEINSFVYGLILIVIGINVIFYYKYSFVIIPGVAITYKTSKKETGIRDTDLIFLVGLVILVAIIVIILRFKSLI